MTARRLERLPLDIRLHRAMAAAVLAFAVGCQGEVEQPDTVVETTPDAVLETPSEPGFGHLSAIARDAALPLPSRVDLDAGTSALPGHASALSDTVETATREALAARGITVLEGAAPILRFNVWLGRAPTPSPRPYPVDPGTRHPIVPKRGADVAEQVTIPVDGPARGAIRRIAISYFLFEPGREPLWNATIEATGVVDNPSVLVARMARAAIQDLGASVERNFVLFCDDPDKPPAGGLCLP